jgi:hypothetical protein
VSRARDVNRKKHPKKEGSKEKRFQEKDLSRERQTEDCQNGCQKKTVPRE